MNRRKDENLMKEITNLRNVIKNKYNELRFGRVESEKQFETQFQPIIEPLRKLMETKPIEAVSGLAKVEPKKEEIDSQFFIPKRASSPLIDEREDSSNEKTSLYEQTPVQFLRSEIVGETSGGSQDPDLSDILSTDQGLESASVFIDETYPHELTRKYMLKLMKDKAGLKTVIDHTFGPRFEGNILMVGDKKLTFDEDGSIRVNDVSYGASEGLYELLFKRLPDEEKYNDNDLNSYKDILQKTNAHKKNYLYQSHINRDRSLKYRYVISKLFPKVLYGKGLLYTKSNVSRDISYWDNPNELCERLKLLIASTESGNNSHVNEILNIVEELREAKLIKGSFNKYFKSLLR